MACLGDLTLDIVVRADVGVEAGTDVSGVIRFRVGGSAANTARSFVAHGGRAVFIGAVGDDELGGRLTAGLRSTGVTVHAPRVRGPSARLLVVVAADGERSFITDRGVADSLAPSMLRQSWFSRVDALHLPAYSLLRAPLAEAAFLAADRARASGRLVSVDLASRRPLLAAGRAAARQLIARAAPDILFANEGEAAALVGRAEHRAQGTRLLELAPVAVIKQGGIGCRVLWRGDGGAVEQAIVATKRIPAADTTGAGDAFDAGFIYSLISSGYGGWAEGHVGVRASAATLRRAALAGHRSAARLLTGPRRELLV